MHDDDAKSYYQLLLQEKEKIEESIGAELEWMELPEKKGSRIALYNEEYNPKDEKSWPIQHEWFIQTLESFDRTFRNRVKALNSGDWNFEDGDTT